MDRKPFEEIQKAITNSDSSDPAIFFDAPISKGPPEADKGIVEFSVDMSTESPMFPILKEILTCMGTSIHPCEG